MFTDSLQITYENQIGKACLENNSFLILCEQYYLFNRENIMKQTHPFSSSSLSFESFYISYTPFSQNCYFFKIC